MASTSIALEKVSSVGAIKPPHGALRGLLAGCYVRSTWRVHPRELRAGGPDSIIAQAPREPRRSRPPGSFQPIPAPPVTEPASMWGWTGPCQRSTKHAACCSFCVIVSTPQIPEHLFCCFVHISDQA